MRGFPTMTGRRRGESTTGSVAGEMGTSMATGLTKDRICQSRTAPASPTLSGGVREAGGVAIKRRACQGVSPIRSSHRATTKKRGITPLGRVIAPSRWCPVGRRPSPITILKGRSQEETLVLKDGLIRRASVRGGLRR